jgi:hypothetical protein
MSASIYYRFLAGSRGFHDSPGSHGSHGSRAGANHSAVGDASAKRLYTAGAWANLPVREFVVPISAVRQSP